LYRDAIVYEQKVQAYKVTDKYDMTCA